MIVFNFEKVVLSRRPNLKKNTRKNCGQNPPFSRFCIVCKITWFCKSTFLYFKAVKEITITWPTLQLLVSFFIIIMFVCIWNLRVLPVSHSTTHYSCKTTDLTNIILSKSCRTFIFLNKRYKFLAVHNTHFSEVSQIPCVILLCKMKITYQVLPSNLKRLEDVFHIRKNNMILNFKLKISVIYG